MTPTLTIEDLLEALGNDCAKHGSALIPATASDLDATPRLRFAWEDFLKAVAAEKPSAVFWQKQCFVPEDYVQECMEEEGWKPVFEMSRRGRWPTPAETSAHVAADLALVERFSGQPYFILAMYTKDGAFRTSSVLLTWANEIAEKISDFIEQRFDDEAVLQEQLHTLEAERIERLSSEIAASAEFQQIRGLPKRLLWVQATYGGKIPPHSRGRIERISQNVDYVDANLAYVVKKAHDKTWVASNVGKA
ncbi:MULTISPECIES: hypothetical protein [unclassified Variovorax]|uniref:hypothetical protein n=1 Tax=unclassified Variovorax TaxID=663243 RepID=UPI0008388163|nr:MULTISPECIES: hypothetical protein [unclassified Variovorax]PNG50397.1 hypothetical protein CHC06_06021 [Variovorax sp. B2]PNG51270.1 hypothetical protein CHC07_05927 [Variovorax sp. B4]VTV17516.1 hypothetical protein WDL1P1_00449 [Variovorax sp. WDL1]